MKLISEEKREFGISALLINNWFDNQIEALDIFEFGVSFTEIELQNLAVEFSEWCVINFGYDKGLKEWCNYEGEFKTTELFSKFITQRNK